jgi:molybdopterin molybdotransferase
VLAGDVHAAHPMPPFTCSAMDGYAVRRTDLAGATPSRPVGLTVVGQVAAGRPSAPVLEPGTTVSVMTGAPVPAGADAVVPLEDTRRLGSSVWFSDPPSRSHIRQAGDDQPAGTRILCAGTLLGSAQLAAAAGAGCGHLEVHPSLRVAVLSTGAELVRPGHTRRFGQIADTNGVMLRGALTENGLDAVPLPAVSDDEPSFRTLLDRLGEEEGRPDLLVTTGGIGRGDRDVVRRVLGPSPTMTFGSVRMRPGAPQGYGTYRGLPVVCLPGNPLAAWVSFHVLLRGHLQSGTGLAPTGPARAELCAPVPRKEGHRTLHLGALDVTGRRVTPLVARSHQVAALAAADCLIVVEEDVTTPLESGTTVTVLRTRPDTAWPRGCG